MTESNRNDDDRDGLLAEIATAEREKNESIRECFALCAEAGELLLKAIEDSMN